MSFQVSTISSKSVYTDAPNVIVVPANTATTIFKNEQQTFGNITQRLIQNVGTNPCFYSENLFDETTIPPTPYCDGTDAFHGVLAAGQQLDCSSHCQAVCVFSPLGTIISTTVRRQPQN